ncbi:MAG TPA: BON domain-containing protein [Vicinamibacteria bacterium]
MAALLLAGASARADDSAIATQAKIERRFEKAGLLESADLQVEVSGRTATLRGVVMTLDARRDAERAAKKEAKVVNNLIRVFPESRPDGDILKDARNAVLRYPYYSVFDSVDLGIEGGVAVLRGSVRNETRRKDIEAAVARVPGLREVKNEIQVQSASFFDDRLRRQIYLAIYGDRLRSFAGRTDGPVRIVVDNGRVTLTGWVNSNVDRQVFGVIARSTLAFDVDNKIKVDGEAPEQDQPKGRPTITI